MAVVRARVRGEKFQVTLPPEVRAALGVESGDEIEFTIDADGVRLRGMRVVPIDDLRLSAEVK
jgi:AbrB family looped-hinge helix DNA binding protein